MGSPWIAGLGAGLAGLGGDLQQREVMRQAKARQDQQDALNALILAQKVGGRILQPGEDPSSILQGVTQRNDAVSGLIPGGTPSAIPNEATGMPGETLPNQFGQPYLAALGGGKQMLINPSQAPEALQEKRLTLTQLALERRAEEAQAAAQKRADAQAKAAQEREDARDKAAANRAAATQASITGRETARDQATASYRNSLLHLYNRRLDQQAKQQAAKAAQPTPDQVKSQTVESLASPAADILTEYYQRGGAQGFAPGASQALSHLPIVGGKLANLSASERDYQNALTASRTLATQYLEIMPKSRFQPSTVDDIMQQIAPEPGKDSNIALRMQKAARVQTLKAAIRKRAALRPDAQTPDLSDIPEPPTEPIQP